MKQFLLKLFGLKSLVSPEPVYIPTFKNRKEMMEFFATCENPFSINTRKVQ